MLSGGSTKKRGLSRPLSAAVAPAGTSKKQANSTLADRLTILNYAAENPHLSQAVVAGHFQKNEFPTMNQSTVSRILGREEETRAEAKIPGNLPFKQPRMVEFPVVEESLVAWVLQVQTKGIRISGEVSQEKARCFVTLQGVDLKEFLSLSNGWLDGFKACHSLKQYRFHGEVGSVDEDAVSAERTRLKKLTDQYGLHDILNMDKTGLNDQMPPDRGLATAQLSGNKANKHRMMYALTTNAAGSDTFPPLAIGHAQHPCCFAKKSGKDLGFDYWWNKKAWMTASIFEGYLKGLDGRMRKEGRQVLLLVDNTPSHIFNPETLTNVTVGFLAPNMTSCIQPNDGGVIKSFKAQFNGLFCKHTIDHKEAGEVDLYKIDQLQSMRLAEEAWSRVTSATIRNCWSHVDILSPRDTNGAMLPEPEEAPVTQPKKKKQLNDPDVTNAVKELNKSIEDLVARGAIPPTRLMDAEEMLGNDEGVMEGTLMEEEILAQVLKDRRAAEASKNDGSEVNSDDESEIDEPVITAAEGMRHLRDLVRLFETQAGREFWEASELIPKLLRKLNTSVQEGKTQSKVTDYFIPWPRSP